VEVARTGGSMLGLAVDGRGRVVGCDDGLGEVVRLDPVTGDLRVLADGLDTPNMAAFGTDGTLYVTCSGEAGAPGIVRIPAGGKAERWSDDVPAYPNGCLVTPDGSALVVVESRAERVVEVPIRRDGSAGSARVIAALPNTEPDGVALDADGALWVTLYRPDGLARIDPDGSFEVVIDDRLARTFDAPTNMAWVGPALDRVVVANVGDRFLAIGVLGVRGAPLHRPEVP
jgi:gluconolactonase